LALHPHKNGVFVTKNGSFQKTPASLFSADGKNGSLPKRLGHGNHVVFAPLSCGRKSD